MTKLDALIASKFIWLWNFKKKLKIRDDKLPKRKIEPFLKQEYVARR